MNYDFDVVVFVLVMMVAFKISFFFKLKIA